MVTVPSRIKLQSNMLYKGCSREFEKMWPLTIPCILLYTRMGSYQKVVSSRRLNKSLAHKFILYVRLNNSESTI